MTLEITHKSRSRNLHCCDVKRLLKEARKREDWNQKNIPIDFQLKKKVINFEELFRNDMIKKKGFLIDTSIRYEKQDNEEELLRSNSIFSAQYGIQDSDPQSVKELKYTCGCTTHNVKPAGEFCPVCGEYSIEHKKDRGWFLLKNFKVPHPDLLYMLVKKNKNPKYSLPAPEKYKPNKTYPHPYPWLLNKDFKYNILGLQDRDTVIEFIKTYAKEDVKDFFLANVDSFMIDKIPVVSKNVRHYKVIKNLASSVNVKSHDINGYLISMNNKIDELNKSMYNGVSTSNLRRCLSDITMYHANILIDVYKQLGDGKGSDFRGKIAGRRKANTANVIVEQSCSFVSYECTLGYGVFGVITINPHQDIYMKYGLTAEAKGRIEKMIPTVSDKILMNCVLKEIQEADNAWIFAYRPPTLYRASGQGLYISGLTNDMAIRVSALSIGPGYNGDHDGDKLLIFLLDEKARLSVAFAFNVRNIAYDPITGSYNDDFELPESIYFSVYMLFDKEIEYNDMVEPDKNVLPFEDQTRVSDDYGDLYNQSLLEDSLTQEEINARNEIQNYLNGIKKIDTKIEERWWS